LAIAGIVILVVILVAAVSAPFLAPNDPLKMNPTDLFQGPSATHLFGTDEFGRDILSRIIWGSRISLAVSVASVAIAVCAGTALGLIAGFYGRLVDDVISRILEVIFAFPSILLALGIVGVLGPSLRNLIVAIGVVYTPVFGRLARGTVLAARGHDYVVAARVCGASDARIIARHILPNIAAPLIVQASLSLSLAVLSEASLSFLGLGTQPPDPSWGTMVNAGQRMIEFSPWLALFSGAAIMLLVLAFNLLGDGLRDALDPRLR
jgi:peptide/nickel transport system permease protein